MSHPFVHAESSVKLFGGSVEDYVKIHSWFDESKAWSPDWRHRMMRHHVEGIKECMEVFGEEIVNSDGNKIKVWDIGVQHQVEDVGFLPTVSDWLENFNEEKWDELKNNKIQERTELPGVIKSDFPLSIKKVL